MRQLLKSGKRDGDSGFRERNVLLGYQGFKTAYRVDCVVCEIGWCRDCDLFSFVNHRIIRL